MNEEPVPAPESQAALQLVLAVSVLGIVTAAIIAIANEPAGWVAGIGVFLAIAGAGGGNRGAVAVGVLTLAASAVVLTHDETTWSALFANAVVVVVCVLMLLGSDLAFVARRSTDMSAVTVRGFVQVHSVATLIGVAVAIAVLGSIFAIDWPGWLLLLPSVLLTAGALAVARVVVVYRREINQKKYLAALPPPVSRPPPAVRGPLERRR